MEYISIILILAVLVSVVTGNLQYILLGITGILLVLSVMLILTFLICIIMLLTSKWKEGIFSKIDLPSEDARFRVAYYLVEGEEIPCLFPEEGVFRKKLYCENRNYKILVNKRLGKVFDRFAVATSILGLISGFLLGWILFMMFTSLLVMM